MLSGIVFWGGFGLWAIGIYQALVDGVSLTILFLVLVGGQLLKVSYAAIESREQEEREKRLVETIRQAAQDRINRMNWRD